MSRLLCVLLAHIPQMHRLQNTGYNIYYTPLKAHIHYLLVDDLNPESLRQFYHDGYQPAVLLESSPRNFQAILMTPALTTTQDQLIHNYMTRLLNQHYGDPKLSGASHPHRAPGFSNRKPIRQKPDGSFPLVTLLKTHNGVCPKTLEWAHTLSLTPSFSPTAPHSYHVHTHTHKDLPSPSPHPSFLRLYWAHATNIIAHQHPPIDYSRIDSMIALRLRILGYTQDDIATILEQCAPTIRSDTKQHQWHDYAQRTAQFAFNITSSQRIPALLKYRHIWQSLA